MTTPHSLMKKHSNLLLLSATILLMPGVSFSQGTFQNLNFESANVPSVPAGQIGSHVTVAQGLPGWNVYVDGVPSTQIGHNDMSIGGAYISIQGPDWNSSQILQGNYTVALWSDSDFNGQPQ